MLHLRCPNHHRNPQILLTTSPRYNSPENCFSVLSLSGLLNYQSIFLSSLKETKTLVLSVQHFFLKKKSLPWKFKPINRERTADTITWPPNVALYRFIIFRSSWEKKKKKTSVRCGVWSIPISNKHILKIPLSLRGDINKLNLLWL